MLGLSELVHTLNIKNDRSLLVSGLLENSFLTIAILVGILLQFLLALIPPVAAVFSLTAITGKTLAVTIILSLAPLLIVELEKRYLN